MHPHDGRQRPIRAQSSLGKVDIKPRRCISRIIGHVEHRTDPRRHMLLESLRSMPRPFVESPTDQHCSRPRAHLERHEHSDRNQRYRRTYPDQRLEQPFPLTSTIRPPP
ncbi:hypothetical protein [Devosia sp. DBB001]|nr:hypothetical protein [Devosia sp. DBB001]